jgi:hypothetical protein
LTIGLVNLDLGAFHRLETLEFAHHEQWRSVVIFEDPAPNIPCPITPAVEEYQRAKKGEYQCPACDGGGSNRR